MPVIVHSTQSSYNLVHLHLEIYPFRAKWIPLCLCLRYVIIFTIFSCSVFVLLLARCFLRESFIINLIVSYVDLTEEQVF